MHSRIPLPARRLAWLALASLAAPVLAADPTVGSRLSAQQLSQLKGTSQVQLGGQAFHVLPGEPGGPRAKSASGVDAATSGRSLVVNEQGRVGETRHALIVSRVAPDTVRQAAGQLGLRPRSASYDAHTGISSLRFTSFEETVRARERLRTLLPPEADVDVPIRYSLRTPK